MCEKYNGWANRETWAVALYINNDQGWQESVLEALRAALADEALGCASCGAAASEHPVKGDKHEYAPSPTGAGEVIKDNLDDVVDALRDATDIDTMHDLLTDIGSLYRVDWTELGAAFLEDLAEES